MKLYELAYACRLYQEQSDEAYRAMRQEDHLGDNPDLASEKQQNSLLEFLNKWGCRIPRDDFKDIRAHLEKWAANWIDKLPDARTDIFSLEPRELERIAESFEELLLVPHLGETGVAKTLHALRYRALPAWDARIKARCCCSKPRLSPGQSYSEFLNQVLNEIQGLKEDVTRLGHSLHKVSELVKRCEPYGISLVKLVDEYYWITITKEHKVPDRSQLEEWLGWESGDAAAAGANSTS